MQPVFLTLAGVALLLLGGALMPDPTGIAVAIVAVAIAAGALYYQRRQTLATETKAPASAPDHRPKYSGTVTCQQPTCRQQMHLDNEPVPVVCPTCRGAF